MHLPVGYENRASHLLRRDIAQTFSKTAEEFGPVGFIIYRIANANGAHVDVWQLLELRFDVFTRFLGLGAAIADRLTGAFINHQRHYAGHAFALFAQELRVEE